MTDSSLLFKPATPSPSPSPGQKSPRRLETEPSPHDGKLRVKKRIIVCCDGTWQDGIGVKHPSKYTNILRLARTIHNEDLRFNPPLPQIVYYQSGIGSEKNFYSEYIEGATGSSLADKVEEAYAFIAHNYFPGDEVFLFGFSRGAYTARMVAMFIGEIGILSRKEMDHFASIFIAYQKLGKSKDKEEIEKLKTELEPWAGDNSPSKKRMLVDQNAFTVRCVGVFDTVGSLGLPQELTLSKQITTLFGFPDRMLGNHIERAYQALALNEPRADFDCAKFEQTEVGRRKKQILKQCWFTGSHSDIGGGYVEHDLADLTLTWMAANIGDMLSLDLKYLADVPRPSAPWGQQGPHDPMTGLFSLAHKIERQLPTATDNITHEVIHPSVLQQSEMYPSVQECLRLHPELVCKLMPLEEEMRVNWPFKGAVVKQMTTEVEAATVDTANGPAEVVTTTIHQEKLIIPILEQAVDKLVHRVHSPEPAST